MKSSAVVISAVCVMLFALSALCEDMYLTLEDGVSVVLHSNHTWSYDEGNKASLSLGKPITLDDGTTLVVNKDGTWGFVLDKQGGSVKSTNLESVNAVGIAKREQVSDAKASAMETALGRLAKQMKSAVPDLANVKEQTLLDCIQKEEKEVESSEEMQEIWKATVKLRLDGTGVRNVLHCVESIRKLGVEEGPEE